MSEDKPCPDCKERMWEWIKDWEKWRCGWCGYVTRNDYEVVSDD